MGIESTIESPFAEAVRIVGSQSAFGRLVGRSQTWVFEALRDGKPLPAEMCGLVSRSTKIPKNVLRPDIFAPEPDPAPHALAPAR